MTSNHLFFYSFSIGKRIHTYNFEAYVQNTNYTLALCCRILFKVKHLSSQYRLQLREKNNCEAKKIWQIVKNNLLPRGTKRGWAPNICSSVRHTNNWRTKRTNEKSNFFRDWLVIPCNGNTLLYFFTRETLKRIVSAFKYKSLIKNLVEHVACGGSSLYQTVWAFWYLQPPHTQVVLHLVEAHLISALALLAMDRSHHNNMP